MKTLQFIAILLFIAPSIEIYDKLGKIRFNFKGLLVFAIDRVLKGENECILKNYKPCKQN